MCVNSLIRSIRQAHIGTTRTLRVNTQTVFAALSLFTIRTLPTISTKSSQ